MCTLPNGRDVTWSSLALIIWDGMPRKLHVPVKASNACGPGIAVLVLECVIFYHINDWAYNSCLIHCNSVQQWLKPTCGYSRNFVLTRRNKTICSDFSVCTCKNITLRIHDIWYEYYLGKQKKTIRWGKQYKMLSIPVTLSPCTLLTICVTLNKMWWPAGYVQLLCDLCVEHLWSVSSWVWTPLFMQYETYSQ